ISLAQYREASIGPVRLVFPVFDQPRKYVRTKDRVIRGQALHVESVEERPQPLALLAPGEMETRLRDHRIAQREPGARQLAQVRDRHLMPAVSRIAQRHQRACVSEGHRDERLSARATAAPACRRSWTS